MQSKKAIAGEFAGHLGVGAFMCISIAVVTVGLHIAIHPLLAYLDGWFGNFVTTALDIAEAGFFGVDLLFFFIWLAYSLIVAVREMIK